MSLIHYIFWLKAPGKLDLKRFNNLSDAIGRLTLNSPGFPPGPTRVGGNNGSFFDGSDYASNNNNNIKVMRFTLKIYIYIYIYL